MIALGTHRKRSLFFCPPAKFGRGCSAHRQVRVFVVARVFFGSVSVFVPRFLGPFSLVRGQSSISFFYVRFFFLSIFSSPPTIRCYLVDRSVSRSECVRGQIAPLDSKERRSASDHPGPTVGELQHGIFIAFRPPTAFTKQRSECFASAWWKKQHFYEISFVVVQDLLSESKRMCCFPQLTMLELESTVSLYVCCILVLF